MKKRRMLVVSISILMLSALFFLSACGEKKEEPEEESSLFSKLNKLAVETVLEKSEIIDESVEVVIDKIHYGAFSDEALRYQENANEIFLNCKLLHMPHVGGLDSRACLLLDADTMDLIAYKEFEGDEVMLNCLQTANGQSRILFLGTGSGQGYRAQWFELWGVRDGEWVELPTGIEELIPEDKKGDWIEDCFCYMAGGDRLVVTYEEDSAFGVKVPSELVAILDWDPHKEKFVLDTNTEQPAAPQEPAEEGNSLSRLGQLAVETVMEKSEIIDESVEVAIDKIHYGSFSRENANEIFVDCKLLHMPHVGGLDSRACFLLDADTFEIILYKEFVGDEVMLHCLQTANGQSRILFLSASGGTGSRAQTFELWGVRDGEWEEFPTGIEEFIPEEHKEIVNLPNKTEIWAGDSFCYMAGGGRLVVTFEEDTAFGVKVPSELSVILDWNPFQERFELVTDIEQPAIQ